MSGRYYSSTSIPGARSSTLYSSYTSPSSPLSSSSTHRVESVSRTTVRSSDSSLGPGGTRSHTSSYESSSRDDGYGPRTTSFSSERSYGGGPGGASYFSTSSYKSPYTGNSFRHMSYR